MARGRWRWIAQACKQEASRSRRAKNPPGSPRRETAPSPVRATPRDDQASGGDAPAALPPGDVTVAKNLHRVVNREAPRPEQKNGEMEDQIGGFAEQRIVVFGDRRQAGLDAFFAQSSGRFVSRRNRTGRLV